MSLLKTLFSLINQIPEGKVTNFYHLALALGDRKAAPTVARILKDMVSNSDYLSLEIPVHRVVSRDGFLWWEDAEKQRELLEREGVEIKKLPGLGTMIKNYRDRLFTAFDSDFPLKKCVEIQIKLSKKVELRSFFSDSERELKELKVAGFDVAYASGKAIGASVVMIEGVDGEVLEKRILTVEESFPYIAGYLSFRELPALLPLYKSLEHKPDISLLDGNGILHPRKMGIASHFGVLLNIPTIGVAKSLLTGRCDGNPEKKREGKIFLNSELVGFYFKANRKVRKPVYISSGHKVLPEEAFQIVKIYSKFRVPEPLRLAHTLATEKRREMVGD